VPAFVFISKITVTCHIKSCDFVVIFILYNIKKKHEESGMGQTGKELGTEMKEIVWKLSEEGKTISYVADLLEIPKSTIGDRKKRYMERGSVKILKRSGRPSSVTTRVTAC
jgi:hypothetical protein